LLGGLGYSRRPRVVSRGLSRRHRLCIRAKYVAIRPDPGLGGVARGADPTELRDMAMVDTARAGFPPDMHRAAEFPAMGSVEGMANDVVDRVKHYAQEKPISFGLWALGIGFVLGWKLKPW